jgi:hypothetical protein
MIGPRDSPGNTSSLAIRGKAKPPGDAGSTLVLQNSVFTQDLQWYRGGCTFGLQEIVEVEILSYWPSKTMRPALREEQIEDVKLRRRASKGAQLR